MTKIFQFNEEALKSILKGVTTLAKAVSATLGPKGRNVVINKKFGSPLSTKDGVTVAKEVDLKDAFEDIGAQVVKQAASTTSDVAGDGTTTAIVLTEAIYSNGVKNIIAGANPMAIKTGIKKAVDRVCLSLSDLASPIQTSEEVKQIATISANNDADIGDIIAKAMEKVGKDGVITVGEAAELETVLKVVEGMQVSKGYASPYFVTNPENMITEFLNPLILIVDEKLSAAKQIIPILEKTMEKGTRPLLIIAEDIDGEALATLVVNKLKAGLPVCAIKAPGFGNRRKDMLEDIAILTGATVVSPEVGHSLEEVGLEVLGSAKTVRVAKDETTIIDGAGKPANIKERIAAIKAEISNTTSSYEKEQLEERLAKLVGGVAIINVGAATETEMKEKKARVEDALHATRAAVAEGILPGGGVALLRAVDSLDDLQVTGDEATGVAIIRQALFAPATAIANNCGEAGNLIAQKTYEAKGAWGYNGMTGQFEDLRKAGVVDPLRVTKTALKNAGDVAANLLTIGAIIADKPVPVDAQAPSMEGMGMGGMGGMGMGGMGMGGMGGMGF